MKCPVTILTGFLGSGKTTLLNRILTDPDHGKRIAVLENEFSLEIGIEKELVVNSDQMQDNFIELIEFGNGCVCCNSRGDFERILHELAEKQIEGNSSFDYIIIETTGLADPVFIQSFFQDEHISEHFYIDSIVTVVDCKHVLHHLEKKSARRNEAIEQLVFADTILLNKVDLVNSEEVIQLQQKIKEINPLAPLISCSYSQVKLSEILDVKAFNLSKLSVDNQNRLLSDTMQMSTSHNPSLTTVVILGRGEVNRTDFENWLRKMLEKYGSSIYRIKGHLAIRGENDQFTLQGVHSYYTIQIHPSQKQWGNDEDRLTKVVFIGNELNKHEINDSFNQEMKIDSFLM